LNPATIGRAASLLVLYKKAKKPAVISIGSAVGLKHGRGPIDLTSGLPGIGFHCTAARPDS